MKKLIDFICFIVYMQFLLFACVIYSFLMFIFTIIIFASYIYHFLKFKKSFHKRAFELIKEGHFYARDIAGF